VATNILVEPINPRLSVSATDTVQKVYRPKILYRVKSNDKKSILTLAPLKDTVALLKGIACRQTVPRHTF